MRQVVLDTETTGISPEKGHRVIEIGCIELDRRRMTENHFHIYINPEREIDEGALRVHGITEEFLSDKPKFADVANDFLDYINGAELVIHNAPFDVGFLDSELIRLGKGRIEDYCTVLDTLTMARKMHPGQRNSLDALCKRYHVDLSKRKLHGALLDSDLLARVYLAMTGGQDSLFGAKSIEKKQISPSIDLVAQVKVEKRWRLKVVQATADELAVHQDYLKLIRQHSNGVCLFDDEAQ